MRNKLSRLLNSFKRDRNLELQADLKINDLLASVELNKIQAGFIPKSSYSMSPALLLHIINDVMINRRRCILEIGSGVSTVYISQIIAGSQSETSFISLDEDAKWQDTIRSYVKSNNCENMVQFLSVPVDKGKWFKESILVDELSRIGRTFDCVIVDGPSTKDDTNVRERAVSFLHEKALLSENYIIFFDDTCRKAEYQASKEGKEILKNSRLFDFKTYAILTNGDGLISRPFFYGTDYKVRKYFERNGN